jgi:hypothetical protein
MNNNRKHRIIKAVPTEVFDGLELNKQKVSKDLQGEYYGNQET